MREQPVTKAAARWLARDAERRLRLEPGAREFARACVVYMFMRHPAEQRRLEALRRRRGT